MDLTTRLSETLQRIENEARDFIETFVRNTKTPLHFEDDTHIPPEKSEDILITGVLWNGKEIQVLCTMYENSRSRSVSYTLDSGDFTVSDMIEICRNLETQYCVK